MVALGCVSNSTNSCTTVFVRTSVFSGSSEISKYLLLNRQLYVNMGEDRGGLLLLDGTVFKGSNNSETSP